MVHQHLGDGGGHKADVKKRQVAEEEIHGAVEVRVQDDGQNGEKILQAPAQIQNEGQAEEQLSLQGLLGQAEEDELRDLSLIVHVQADLEPETGRQPWEGNRLPHCSFKPIPEDASHLTTLSLVSPSVTWD